MDQMPHMNLECMDLYVIDVIFHGSNQSMCTLNLHTPVLQLKTVLIVRSLTGYFRRVILVQLERNIPATIFATQMANEIIMNSGVLSKATRHLSQSPFHPLPISMCMCLKMSPLTPHFTLDSVHGPFNKDNRELCSLRVGSTRRSVTSVSSRGPSASELTVQHSLLAIYLITA
jgi:hypothetical protein